MNAARSRGSGTSPSGRQRLSKSKVQSGAQCHLKLWYQLREPELAGPTSEAQQAIFDQGTHVGELARQRYPGGLLIDAEYWDIEGALEQTAAARDLTTIPALFEPAFIHDDVLVRVDVLRRSSADTHDLIEVKSATKAKDVYVQDAAIQVHVLRGAGIGIERAGLLTLNRDYIYDGERLDLDRLFRFHDCSDEIDSMQPEVEGLIDELHEVMSQPEPPRIAPGPHCSVPYDCEFHAHCTRGLPVLEHPVSTFSRIGAGKLAELAEAGIEEISEIPDDFPLNELHTRIRDCVIHDREWISATLGADLEPVRGGVHYLDFETFSPAIPRYAGTRPFEAIPFQYSIHSESQDGALRHVEFLHEEKGDPRRPLAERLLRDLEAPAPICVYSPFEKGVISRLADTFPDLAAELLRLRDRLWDLLPLIRRSYYHPAFAGSFSIKSVLPAVVPGLSYDGLEIQDGMQASRRYEAALESEDPIEREPIFSALREYCGLDTMAMVELKRALVEKTGDR